MNKKLSLAAILMIALAFASTSVVGVSSIKSSTFIPLPDLVVTEIWVKERIVYYTVSNIGDKEAGASISTLKVDGEEVARDYSAPSLAPGEEITSSFSTYRLPFGTHEVTVVADSSNFVFESDETNNSKTETITQKLGK
jgi:subtilase family serine protease